MAKTEKRVRERLGSSSYFLGCFGFSRKIYSEKPMVAKEDGGEKKKKKKVKNYKRISHWFLCSKFRMKNSEIKPSPIEETEKPTLTVEDVTDDKHKPLSVIRRTADRKIIPVDDKSVNQEIKEPKPKDLRDITPDRSKPMEPLGLFKIKEVACPERISTSTRYEKLDLKPTWAKNGSRVDKFDPVIGISIIILTLMIMLVWGRLCAILCTSALCYVLPRVRDAAVLAQRKRNGNDGSAFVSDLNSESYKRKVVLDGFLGRQNRVSLS